MNPIDLTTVAAVEAWLNQANVDTALIQSAITNYSQFVLTFTGRTNLNSVASYSETYSGSGGDRLFVRNYPILAVSSLVIGTTNIPQSTSPQLPGWVIDTAGSTAAVALRSGGGSTILSDQWPSRWGAYGNAPPLGCTPYRFVEGIQNVAIAYQAGYTQQATQAANVPGTPGPYTFTVTNAATFWADLGVSGLTLTTGSPGPGQYSVSAGIYTFNAAQQGQAIAITYAFGAAPLDLQQSATQLVAAKYRSRQWIEQLSQIQPGVGTTSYSKLAIPADVQMVIDRYRMRFLPQ